MSGGNDKKKKKIKEQKEFNLEKKRDILNQVNSHSLSKDLFDNIFSRYLNPVFVKEGMNEQEIANAKAEEDKVRKEREELCCVDREKHNECPYSIERGALLSMTFARLVSKGFSIDDIMDPAKLHNEKDEAVKEVLENFAVNNPNFEWIANTVKSAGPKMLEYVDSHIKGLDFANPASILTENNVNLLALSSIMTDFMQEFCRETTVDGVAQHYLEKYWDDDMTKLQDLLTDAAVVLSVPLKFTINVLDIYDGKTVNGIAMAAPVVGGNLLIGKDINEILKKDGSFIENLYNSTPVNPAKKGRRINFNSDKYVTPLVMIMNDPAPEAKEHDLESFYLARNTFLKDVMLDVLMPGANKMVSYEGNPTLKFNGMNFFYPTSKDVNKISASYKTDKKLREEAEIESKKVKDDAKKKKESFKENPTNFKKVREKNVRLNPENYGIKWLDANSEEYKKSVNNQAKEYATFLKNKYLRDHMVKHIPEEDKTVLKQEVEKYKQQLVQHATKRAINKEVINKETGERTWTRTIQVLSRTQPMAGIKLGVQDPSNKFKFSTKEQILDKVSPENVKLATASKVLKNGMTFLSPKAKNWGIISEGIDGTEIRRDIQFFKNKLNSGLDKKLIISSKNFRKMKSAILSLSDKIEKCDNYKDQTKAFVDVSLKAEKYLREKAPAAYKALRQAMANKEVLTVEGAKDFLMDGHLNNFNNYEKNRILFSLDVMNYSRGYISYLNELENDSIKATMKNKVAAQNDLNNMYNDYKKLIKDNNPEDVTRGAAMNRDVERLVQMTQAYPKDDPIQVAINATMDKIIEFNKDVLFKENTERMNEVKEVLKDRSEMATKKALEGKMPEKKPEDAIQLKF